jgi:hypothetical protein
MAEAVRVLAPGGLLFFTTQLGYTGFARKRD